MLSNMAFYNQSGMVLTIVNAKVNSAITKLIPIKNVFIY